MAFVTDNIRHKDVLIALYMADKYGQKLGRLQLQKFIYLADTISVLWNTLAPKMGHITYDFGPYDQNIQNAVDVLAFRGFVSVVDYKIVDERVQASYRISKQGVELYDALEKNRAFKNRISLYEEIAVQVNKRNWLKLKEMVYSEPGYSVSRVQGHGFQFDYSSSLKNDSLRILLGFDKMLAKGKTVSKQNMVSLFFKLLN